MAESKVGKASKPWIEPSTEPQKFQQQVERLSSQESDQQEEQDMTESGEEISSDSPNERSMGSQGSDPPEEPLMGTNPPMELWVGYVNDVPLVGTSANMVDGFIALLLGDREAAVAKGYKDFLDSAGINELTARSILKNHGSQAVIGCSAKESEYIFYHILMAGTGTKKSKPTSSEIKAAEVVKDGEQLFKDLNKFIEVLMLQLKNFPGEFSREGPKQNSEKQKSKRGEHVFNKGLLKLYWSIMDLFIKKHVKCLGRKKLDDCIPNTQVSDACKWDYRKDDPRNLCADHRQNISDWVVHIPGNVKYISVNDFWFGCMVETIRIHAINSMHLWHLQETDIEVLCSLTYSVERMIRYRLYLDPMAARQWFDENPDLIPQFHDTEKGVKVMLRHLVPQDPPPLLCDFVNDLTQAVKETGAKIKDHRIFRDKCTRSKKKS